MSSKKELGALAKFKKRLKEASILNRAFSVLCMLVFFGIIFSLGKPAVTIVGGLMAIIMVWEWDKMFNKKYSITGVLSTISILSSMAYVYELNTYKIPSIILVSTFSLLMIVNILLDRKHWILSAVSSMYIGFPMIAAIYMLENFGLYSLIYIFVITIATDTGAYFVGFYFRGPKLAPKISPKKTWSGFFGGLTSAFILSGTYSMWLFFVKGFDIYAYIPMFCVFAIILSLIAQLGDLFESYCKRLTGIKDTSNLISGHGGFLDRFDSFLAIAPIVAFIFAISNVVLK